MKTFLLIHGPNLNFLGKRDKKIYGTLSLKELESKVKIHAKNFGFKVLSFQSNFEGALIDFLQKSGHSADGIIINPGALTHYSYSLHDALLDANLPAVEVHLSEIKHRESWRKKSVTAPACKKLIFGKGIKGYFEAIEYLKNS